jgi:hypothetical protein
VRVDDGFPYFENHLESLKSVSRETVYVRAAMAER